MPDMTTVKVPSVVRDRVRRCTAPGSTQGETIMRALDALERETFREQMAAADPDEGYWSEAADWLAADLASPRRPADGRPTAQ